MPDSDDHIDELVAKLRDSEGGDGEELAALLHRQPEQRERFLKQMFLSGLLREAFGESDTLSKRTAPRQRRWMMPALATAAAIVTAAIALWPRVDNTLIATLESAQGVVLIDGERVAEGAAISPGQKVELRGLATTAAFNYPDGTRVLIDGEARLALADADHKRLEVATGVLHADVAKQPAGRPMRIVTPTAQLEIVGTRFVVGAGSEKTDLNVTEGRVRMKRTDGDSIDVAAGERARFAAGHTLQISELPDVPDTWRRDFEAGEGLAVDEEGLWIGEGLPGESRGGLATNPFVLTSNGNTYHGIRIRDLVDGYCTVGENTHLELTFRTGEWFNLFISTIGPDPDGKLEVRKFKLGARNLNRRVAVQDHWHSLVVPISAFTGLTKSGRQRDHIGYGGPPPESGHVIRSIFFSHPEPHRDLQVDSIGFSPEGPGEKVITTLGR